MVKDNYDCYTYKDDFIEIQSPCAIASLPDYINTNYDDYRWFKTLSSAEYCVKLDYKTIYLGVVFNSILETISNKQNLKKWVDIEEEYFLALKGCFEDKNNFGIDKLNSDFSNLRTALVSYLKKEEANLVSKNKIIERNIFSPLFLPEYIDKTDTEKINSILFLSFNYTCTDLLYEDNNFSSSRIHIHGELDYPENPIIFGYGDELDDKYKLIEQANDNRYLENIKSINYMETRNYSDVLNFISSAKYEIFIMGHSCGISDRTLLNTLFEHKNCVCIKVFYHRKDDGTDNFSDVVRNISRNFSDKSLFRARVINKRFSLPMLEYI